MYCHLAHNNAGKHYIPSRMHEDVAADEDDTEAEEIADSVCTFLRGPPLCPQQINSLAVAVNTVISKYKMKGVECAV